MPSASASSRGARTWVGKHVVIEGQVTHMMFLLLVRYFTLDDGTGTMNVVTEKPLPAQARNVAANSVDGAAGRP